MVHVVPAEILKPGGAVIIIVAILFACVFFAITRKQSAGRIRRITQHHVHNTSRIEHFYQRFIPVFCSHDALIAIEEAVPNPRNPNQHSEQQADVLGNIIQATGWRQPITISKRSDFITKGHGRLLAAQRKGWKQVPADFQEYATEAEEWSDLIADNRLAELSTIDNERLMDLIKEIGDDVPMELTGFSNEDISDIIHRIQLLSAKCKASP